MLNETDIIVIFLSGFIGSLIVLLTSYLASKYGSISGIITTIPTNTLVSLLGISINVPDTELLQKNIYSTIILCYCAFIYLLIFWVYLPTKIVKYNYPIIKTCIFSISFYCVISFVSYTYFILNVDSFFTNKDFFILAIISIFKYYYFSSIHKFLYEFQKENIESKSVSKYELLFRFISSFLLISVIVLIGKINQLAGVIMSSFPLLSLINSIILWKQTENPILISQLNSNILIGGTTIYMYILSFGFLVDKIEIYLNVIISLLLSLIIYNYPIYISLKKINRYANTETKKRKVIISEI